MTVCRRRPGEPGVLTASDTSACICAILGDRDGRLWLSTDRGLSRFDPATGAFRNDAVRDGLRETDLFSHESCTDGDGVSTSAAPHGLQRGR
jgi:ligand-binding sensor domain-containing protein